MPVNDPTRVYDGNKSWDGGVESSLPSTLLNQNQCAWATNRTMRGGYNNNRPGWTRRQIGYPQALFQGLGTYYADSGQVYAAVSIGGRIFLTELGIPSYPITELTAQPSTVTVVGTSVAGSGTTMTITFVGAVPSWITIGSVILTSGSSTTDYNGQLVTISSIVGLVVTGTITYPVIEAHPGGNLTLSSTGNIINSATQPHTWFSQGHRNLVIQNNLELPIFYNGVSVRRSNGNTTTLATHELPPGGPIYFWGGRFWFTQKSNFGAGNLAGSDLSLADPNDAALQCTDNDFLNEGGLFTTPTTQGDITAITSSQNVDTANGEGSLLIGTPQGVFAFNAPIDRTEWKNLQQPIQQYALIGFGPVSQESFDTVNADMFFRSSDSHVRTFFFSRRDFQTQWGNIPISRQLQRAIDGEAQNWLYGCSGCEWNNWYLFTLKPQRDQVTGIYYKGLGALDFFNVGGIGNKTPPAWDGVWSSIQFFGIFTATINNQKRLFGWVRNQSNNTIELWECDPNTRQDYTGSAYVDFPWSFETRSYNFAGQDSSLLDLKQLKTADLWMDQVYGTLNILGYYKPSLAPQWLPWAQTSYCVGTTSCDPNSCTPPVFNNPLPYDRIAFQNPDPAAGPTLNKSSSWGYNFETRITGTGQVRFKELRMAAQVKPEPTTGDLSGSSCLTAPTIACTSGCPSVAVCAVNDYL